MLLLFPFPSVAKDPAALPPDNNAPFALAVLGPWFCSLRELIVVTPLILLLDFIFSVLPQPVTFAFKLTRLFE